MAAFLSTVRAESVDAAQTEAGETAQEQSPVADEHPKHPTPSWNTLKDLPVKAYLDKAHKVAYYEIQTDNNSKATFIVAPIGAKSRVEIRPVVNKPNLRTSDAAHNEGALAAVNAAYFNLNNGQSASYITVNGQQICDPHTNAALMNNPKLKPHMAEILNRSELRFLSDPKEQLSVVIQNHNDAPPTGTTLKYAIQAGPRLLPTFTGEAEAFIRKDADGSKTDSIGCLKTAARTAFGITADGHAIVICVSGPKQDEFSSGVTLLQLSGLLSKLGCVQAINFDGGTSSTMAIKSDLLEGKGASSAGKPNQGYTLVCGRDPETQVKSCLIIK